MDDKPNLIQSILILGIGNSLLSDDGFGVHVIDKMREKNVYDTNIILRDGGTIGLSLLPEIEEADHLIVVDAAEISEEPGTLRVFENSEMDDHLSRHKSTVHEVAMVDLLSAARLTNSEPKTRTLIAVQPQCLDWGTAPTQEILAAIPNAIDAIEEIIKRRLAA